MKRSVPSGGRLKPAAIATMLALPAVVLLGACGGGVPDEPDGVLDASTPTFSDVQSMVVNSDVVVLGTVTGIAPGRKVGEANDLQYRDVSVRVGKMLFSRLARQPAEVVVQEVGWSNGKSVELSDLAWSHEGDRGYFFLQNDVPGKFGYLGPQARILVEAQAVHSGGEDELAPVLKVNALTPTSLAEEITAAAEVVTTQKIPNPPGPATGDPA